MKDIIKTNYENQDMKKAINQFSSSLKNIKETKNDVKYLTFQDGFDHAMNMVRDSFRTFLEGYDEP